MFNIDTYFLTEFVSLEYRQLIQRGIRLGKDRKELTVQFLFIRANSCQFVAKIPLRPLRFAGWRTKGSPAVIPP